MSHQEDKFHGMSFSAIVRNLDNRLEKVEALVAYPPGYSTPIILGSPRNTLPRPPKGGTGKSNFTEEEWRKEREDTIARLIDENAQLSRDKAQQKETIEQLQKLLSDNDSNRVGLVAQIKTLQGTIEQQKKFIEVHTGYRDTLRNALRNIGLINDEE